MSRTGGSAIPSPTSSHPADAMRTTAGLILAGGSSNRFGSEKAVARIGGRLMLDAVAECFTPLLRLAVSAQRGSGAERWAQERGIDVVHDGPALSSGPLAGVEAGMRWAEEHGFSHLATAPCDTPFLPHDLFTDLHGHIGNANAAYAVTESGPHPLCALWRVDLLSRMQAELTDGRHPPVHALLRDIGATPVRFADERAFANANTAAALSGSSLEP